MHTYSTMNRVDKVLSFVSIQSASVQLPSRFSIHEFSARYQTHSVHYCRDLADSRISDVLFCDSTVPLVN